MQTYKKFFIGVDFSKEKFDATAIDENEKVLSHQVFDNAPAGFKQFEAWMRKSCGLAKENACEQILICGEHTGFCSIEFADRFHALGYKVWLEMAAQIRYSIGVRRGKSDEADAMAIAKYAKRHASRSEGRLYVPDSDEMRRLKALVLEHETLVKERVATTNRLKSKAFDASPESVERMKARVEQLRKDEAEVDREIKILLAQSQEMGRNYELLVSVPGIGVLTAAVLLIATSNFKLCGGPRALACYVGVAPFRAQSGTSVHSRPHASKFSNKGVRAVLRNAATVAVRFNPPLKEYCERLIAKGKARYVVKTNCINKLIHIACKIVESKKPFDPRYAAAHAKKKGAA